MEKTMYFKGSYDPEDAWVTFDDAFYESYDNAFELFKALALRELDARHSRLEAELGEIRVARNALWFVRKVD